MQQSRLDYLCDVGSVPTTSPFAGCLRYVQEVAAKVGEQIVNSEETLKSLIERLTSMGLGDSVSRWLEGRCVVLSSLVFSCLLFSSLLFSCLVLSCLVLSCLL